MAQLQAVLEGMAESGGSVVDTARVYGRAEVVTGDLLERMGNRDHFFIATKTPISGELRAPEVELQTSVDAQYAAQMEGMRRYPLDFIQVDYSIANRSAADEILPLAEELGIAILVNVPFGGRGQGAAATFGRVSDVPLPDWAADIDAESWAQVFLKYVVSHPAVTAAIPGTTQASHMLDN